MHQSQKNKDPLKDSSDLELRNIAWHKIMLETETALNNIKAPEDEYKTKEFLEKVKKDLGVVMDLHYDKLTMMDGYIIMQKQNNKLYAKYNALKDAKKKGK